MIDEKPPVGCPHYVVTGARMLDALGISGRFLGFHVQYQVTRRPVKPVGYRDLAAAQAPGVGAPAEAGAPALVSS